MAIIKLWRRENDGVLWEVSQLMEPLSGARCVKFDVKTRVIPELIQANQRYTRRASDIIRQMHTTLKLESKEEFKDISNDIFWFKEG